ncbi:MAG: hypothetical protein PUJ51_25140 [Clostridiales bacterium]|uniref:hypothetical protein n=1 Tax=Terrisporobacter sp. TaxID=1965305 RepID=UPI002A556478|nr:hypothetical protein [Terrisporobacter sp.]MDD7757744.1 hypothetical protein [Clostridiales bacterium]MDY3778229.1 hypothetical protein [Candidatus Onthovivens sp.]MDY3828007.1 hypothetical protein [Clostridium sp.]MDY4136479.1 hypothetical protein [Terrisporobacter sp.]
MKEKECVQIPFIVHESECNRLERQNKNLIKVVIIQLIVILSMFGGIMAYFYLPSEIIEDNIQDVNDVENSNITQSNN